MKVSRKEFLKRRQQLLGHMLPGSIAILPAGPVQRRNRDTEYPYRQDSDFVYLTGFTESDAILVLIPGREHGESVLFCKEKDPEFERWNGTLVGPEAAVSDYLFDDAFPISDVDEILPGLIEGKQRVYSAMGLDEKFDRQLMEWVNQIRSKVRSGAQPPGEFLALQHVLHDMRLYKSANEVNVMRRAGEISAEAHCRAMQVCRPGMYEYQLEAEIVAHCAREGARFQAYPPIVGGGANACVLHYISNQDKLRRGDLVLIDAGCELDHYASDITRTFPVGGKFSKPQQALYEIVLNAQLAALEASRPDSHWNQPHEAAVEVLTQGLVDLGLLPGSDVAALIEEGAYREFYMHRTGHWLGLDVHDVGEYKVGGEWRVLEPGMVFTVEPGLYIAPDCATVDEKWRGIGIRIEDDVLITKQGHEVLTGGVPKSVADIQSLMKRAS